MVRLLIVHQPFGFDPKRMASYFGSSVLNCIELRNAAMICCEALEAALVAASLASVCLRVCVFLSSFVGLLVDALLEEISL